MREQTRREVAAEREQPTVETTEEAETTTRFGRGQVPPVDTAFGEHHGTAELAFAEDSNERELKQKVGKLVADRFGGDYKAAFAHYDHDHDGSVAKSELVALLADAGVGSGLTRGIWASKIIERLDANTDGGIQWAEFESVFRASA